MLRKRCSTPPETPLTPTPKSQCYIDCDSTVRPDFASHVRSDPHLHRTHWWSTENRRTPGQVNGLALRLRLIRLQTGVPSALRRFATRYMPREPTGPHPCPRGSI